MAVAIGSLRLASRPLISITQAARLSKASFHTDPSRRSFSPASPAEAITSQTPAAEWPTQPLIRRPSNEQGYQKMPRPGNNRVLIQVYDKVHPFDLTHLRDSCRCPRCVDTSTRQRTFETAQIPPNISIRSITQIRARPSAFRIEWANDIPGFEDHASIFSETVLAQLHYSPLPPHPNRELWKPHDFVNIRRKVAFKEYMNNPREFCRALHHLEKYGLLFLRDVPEDPESVAKIAERIGPLRNSFYGSTWDVRNTPNATNVASTNGFLGYHMDLLYTAQPPGYQFLHFMKNDLEGGESLFTDSFRAATALREKFPEAFEVLKTFPVTFHYNNDNQYFKQTCKTISTTTLKGQEIITDVRYSPPFQCTTMMHHSDCRYSFSEFANAMRLFKNLLDNPSEGIESKMQAGECVIFHNLRILHARRAFAATENSQGGDRWLRGAYVDEDHVMSKFRGAHQQYPEYWVHEKKVPWVRKKKNPNLS